MSGFRLPSGMQHMERWEAPNPLFSLCKCCGAPPIFYLTSVLRWKPWSCCSLGPEGTSQDAAAAGSSFKTIKLNTWCVTTTVKQCLNMTCLRRTRTTKQRVTANPTPARLVPSRWFRRPTARPTLAMTASQKQQADNPGHAPAPPSGEGLRHAHARIPQLRQQSTSQKRNINMYGNCASTCCSITTVYQPYITSSTQQEAHPALGLPFPLNTLLLTDSCCLQMAAPPCQHPQHSYPSQQVDKPTDA